MKSGWIYNKHTIVHVIYDRDGNESDRIEEDCHWSGKEVPVDAEFDLNETGPMRAQCDECAYLVTLSESEPQ